ncbi:hypothetical protein KsCSTR_34460 [Candidatus Kuenenia stuttgartiensis]|nr:hypothetical protein KsCSTR_34460 [Candidatus Kuenenia stuttgartiensis]
MGVSILGYRHNHIKRIKLLKVKIIDKRKKIISFFYIREFLKNVFGRRFALIF